MKTPCILLSATLLALAGCAAQDAPGATADMAPPAGTAAATMPASTLHTAEDATMQIDCQGVRLRLADGDRHAGGAQVSIERDGATRALESPAGMAGYVPVGIGCIEATGSAPHFVVEYGEPGEGCAVCEWFFLYDGSGALLNHSEPALREQDGGGLGSNNDEYEARLSELGLQHPQITYPAP